MRFRRGSAAVAALTLFCGLAAADTDCTRIQDGILEYAAGHYLAGEPLETGFDPFGYNYGAHSFNSNYANAYLGGDGLPPLDGDVDDYLADNPGAASKWYWYPDVQLAMKWNDAWIADTDCDGDGKLDRHYGYASYLDSGAWLTNHMSGGSGKDKWTYFVKIGAAKSSWTRSGGNWYDGATLVGPVIWSEFVILQEVSSGPGGNSKAPVGPGLGNL